MTHYKEATKFFATLLYIFILFFFLYSPALSGEDPDTAGDRPFLSGSAEKSENAFTYPVRFFKKYISGVDGDRCPMHPTCSRYCLNSVKKHGAVMGWIMTCDRLLRCGGDEIRTARQIKTQNDLYFYDPVENNDFWWKGR